MCPVCIATALVIASGAVSGGGLAVVVMKKCGVKKKRATDESSLRKAT